ncbi:pentatricopeptide repeat-containing protein At1g07740, mitochondrial [Phragmites australis]|uniref:pentatricopeptide repeat-containing protein At1g07740, mitochondrial n=1 Tax=Phragmites australis TaxID=29695 RepID=UPI002D77A7D3|nr:pentatricopeptide repeat-containing protein At1g07740, mitochondrial [Phragmites australis]
MPATAATQRRRRYPKKLPYKPKPPPEPHPFLLHLKSLPSPIAAAAALLSAPRHLHDHPFAACVLYRLARARLFPLVLPLLSALRSLRVPLQPTAFAALIDHLGAASRPDAAVLVFRAVPAFCSHSNATFHALLHSLVCNGRVDAARDMLPQAPKLGVRTNAVSYNVILKGVCHRDGFSGARPVLDEMLGRGVRPTVVTFNTLVGSACREGELAAAERLTDEMARRGAAPNAVTYALLMQGLCNAGRYDDAKKLMFDMEYRGCQPEAANYGVLMSACARRGDPDGVRVLLSDMRKRKLKPDDASYNVLIRCLCDAGRVDEAHRALVEMQLKDTATPSAATYRVLVDGCCSARDFGLGLRVFNAMLASGHYPLARTFQRLVRGLGEESKAEEACFVLEQMEKRGMRLDADGWQSVAACVCSSSSSPSEMKLVDDLALSS